MSAPVLLVGDCLDHLLALEPGRARLAYLDPPFFTQKVQQLATRDRKRRYRFDDTWSSLEQYAEFLGERLSAVRRVLADDASVVFHCDRRTTHLARALLDRVFGAERFRSEVIWHYRRWSNSRRELLPSHQTLFVYAKGESAVFNPMLVEYSPATNVDQILQRRTRDAHGKSIYERDASGAVVVGRGKPGVPLGDVWDIPYLNPKARERVGYPTQKPLLLLERILRLLTHPGDTVLDPFCGSGTTLVAAQELGREAIGIDASERAIELCRHRLADPVRTESRLLRRGRESYRSADSESVRAALGDLELSRVQRNRGIDGILKSGSPAGPVAVRAQRAGEPLPAALAALLRAGRSVGCAHFALVVTDPEGEPLLDDPPSDVVVLESPAVQLARRLRR